MIEIKSASGRQKRSISTFSLWRVVARCHFWYRTRKPMYGTLMVREWRRDVADYTKPCRSADIAVIRTEHRVCGTLLGTLPHLSQQNVFLGVPLVLQPEEAVLLVDKGRETPLAFRVRSLIRQNRVRRLD